MDCSIFRTKKRHKGGIMDTFLVETGILQYPHQKIWKKAEGLLHADSNT